MKKRSGRGRAGKQERTTRGEARGGKERDREREREDRVKQDRGRGGNG